MLRRGGKRTFQTRKLTAGLELAHFQSQRHCKDHLQWHQAKVFTMFQVEMLTLVPNLSLKSVMSYTTQICQDSVLLAGQRVKRKL
ncbi:hypothetical protein pdam_00026024, partial [Pocillopora damicornis]